MRSANGKLCGRRHAVKKVCEKRKLDGRGVFIFRYTAEKWGGRGAALDTRNRCAPVNKKLCGGNSASRQPGNHIIGIPAASSATYGRRQCGDLYYRRFFINIIYREIIGIFSIAPRKPRNTGVPACQVRLFYIASAGLDKYFVRWYNICAKEQMFVLARGVYPNHRPVSPGGYFNRKTEQMFD